MLLTFTQEFAMISGTELLLEPSGGRALLLEKSEIPSKRSEMSAPPEIIQVFPTEPDETETKVESKRAAILLDKIMYAVQKALDENKVPGKDGVGATPADLAAFTGVSRRGVWWGLLHRG